MKTNGIDVVHQPNSPDNTTQSFQTLEFFSLVNTILNSRVKRADAEKTLVEATAKGDYTYWLSQEDIAECARLEYKNYQQTKKYSNQFEIIGSLTQLKKTIKKYLTKTQNKVKKGYDERLTLIIHFDETKH